jgi:hypothetical protein
MTNCKNSRRKERIERIDYEKRRKKVVASVRMAREQIEKEEEQRKIEFARYSDEFKNECMEIIEEIEKEGKTVYGEIEEKRIEVYTDSNNERWAELGPREATYIEFDVNQEDIQKLPEEFFVEKNGEVKEMKNVHMVTGIISKEIVRIHGEKIPIYIENMTTEPIAVPLSSNSLMWRDGGHQIQDVACALKEVKKAEGAYTCIQMPEQWKCNTDKLKSYKEIIETLTEYAEEDTTKEEILTAAAIIGVKGIMNEKRNMKKEIMKDRNREYGCLSNKAKAEKKSQGPPTRQMFDELYEEQLDRLRKVQRKQLDPYSEEQERQVKEACNEQMKESVPEDTRLAVLDLVGKYKHVFYVEGNPFPTVKDVEADFKIHDYGSLRVQQPFRSGPYETEQVKFSVQPGVEEGLLEFYNFDKNKGPVDEPPIAAAPVFPIKRKGCLIGRLVTDYRNWNKCSIGSAWRSPNMELVFEM